VTVVTLAAAPPQSPSRDPGRRACCARCERPLVTCVCSFVTPLSTRTRVLLLQHPRESRVGVGTARLAHLALPSSIFRAGLDFAHDATVQAALAGPAPAYLLFPGAAAIDVADLPRDVAVTLVVVDGTWSQARKLLRLNPALAALPRVAFTPRAPSIYHRIRRQPAAHCVSTIEALAETLAALEPADCDVERLLDPLRALVARQEWFATTVRSQRHHLPVRVRRPSRRARLADALQAAWPSLICVQGEANAWSARRPDRPAPEIVHWVAHRPATGETYEAIVAPRQPLAPSTPVHIGLSAQRLHAGGTVEGWRHGWRAFARPGDHVVQWGRYYGELAAGGGLELEGAPIDLRAEASQALRRRLGTVEDCLGALAVGPASLGLQGRGGRRLAALVAAVTALRVAP
jgi:DTW domain-containing protein YfiP